MERRDFTLAQANRTLPFVTRVVGDLVAKAAEYRKLEERRREVAQRGGVAAEKDQVERGISRVEGDLERLAAELTPIGCELKDLEKGLIDFPARMGDERICLCWKAGEERIDFWHTLDGGFAGRRPIAELPAATRGEA
jgi:hypothetical protein